MAGLGLQAPLCLSQLWARPGQVLAALGCMRMCTHVPCPCPQKGPLGATLQKDTIQVVVLDPHEADPTVRQDG